MLNIKRNTIQVKQTGISVPETMNGEISDNYISGSQVGVEVRSIQQDLLEFLRDGYPEDKIAPLLIHLIKIRSESFEQKEEAVQKSGLAEWLKHGTTITEFTTALISLAATVCGS
ncbi:hypothetical protein [Enterobacter kobei]|uniref:hypothetical protein n=1 Tax=Enterobacter kobei TaxID=208224 RepID=UPI002A81D760|nr:hypothetical protein [Enterobacter kobei]